MVLPVVFYIYVLSNATISISILNTVLKLPFPHAKSIKVNPFEHTHLPFSHIPELGLLVHWMCILQNPPTGTVSEMIKNDNVLIKNSTKKG